MSIHFRKPGKLRLELWTSMNVPVLTLPYDMNFFLPFFFSLIIFLSPSFCFLCISFPLLPHSCSWAWIFSARAFWGCGKLLISLCRYLERPPWASGIVHTPLLTASIELYHVQQLPSSSMPGHQITELVIVIPKSSRCMLWIDPNNTLFTWYSAPVWMSLLSRPRASMSNKSRGHFCHSTGSSIPGCRVGSGVGAAVWDR